MIRDRGTKHTHVSTYIHTQHPLNVSVLEGPPARVRVGSTPARVSVGSTLHVFEDTIRMAMRHMTESVFHVDFIKTNL